MNTYQFKRLPKILSIIAFLFLFLVLNIIAITPPSNGYEISIYTVFPWYFWIFISISVLISISIIIFASISKDYKYWKYGFFSLIISYFIFLLLPYFRGYALYWRSGDLLTHIGWSNTIMSSGHTAIEDFYPVIHILITDLRYLGIYSEIVTMFLPAFFTILYLLFILLLSKTISKNFDQSLFILVFSTPLLFSYFHLTVHPSILSFYTIPILLYCLHKANSHGEKINIIFVFLIFAFLIVFFHPTTTMILIIILFVFKISNYIKKRIYKIKTNNHDLNLYIIIIFVSFFTIFITYSTLLSIINVIIDGFIYGDVTSVFSSNFQILEKGNLELTQILDLLIRLYGPILIYFIVALVCLFWVIKQSQKKIVEKLQIDYGLQLIAGLVVGIILFFCFFIEKEPIRVMRYFILIAPLFIGITLYNIFNKIKNNSKSKITFVFIIFLIIIPSGILSIFNVYQSPITAGQNPQITNMDIKGISWFLDNGENQTPITVSFLNLRRFENYMNDNIDKFQPRPQIQGSIPTHFDYEKNTTLAETYHNITTYMITDEFSRQYYLAYPENVRDKSKQYKKEDFNKLNSDLTVIKSYSNGEFEVWLIS